MGFDKNAVRSIDVASGDAVIEARVAGDGPTVVMLAGHLRWPPPAGQSGGLDKLGSGCHQAANFSIPGAQYMSSGVPPASIECGRREL